MAFRFLASLLFASVFLMAGCSSTAPLGGEVGIHSNTYDPASITIDAGERVHFDNHDTTEHSVTADSGGAFDTDIDGGKGGDVKFSTSGTFAYHCKYHASMHGTVIVR